MDLGSLGYTCPLVEHPCKTHFRELEQVHAEIDKRNKKREEPPVMQGDLLHQFQKKKRVMDCLQMNK